MTKSQPNLEVFTIITRSDEKNDYWHRIGSAWFNKDHSINVKLNALPVNGELHLRPPKIES